MELEELGMGTELSHSLVGKDLERSGPVIEGPLGGGGGEGQAAYFLCLFLTYPIMGIQAFF